jgi:hypothetical protein
MKEWLTLPKFADKIKADPQGTTFYFTLGYRPCNSIKAN